MNPSSLSLSSATTTAPFPVSPHSITSVAVDFTTAGTLTYSIEYTNDNVFASDYSPGSGTWVTCPEFSGLTAAKSAQLTYSVKAVRLKVSAYTSGTVRMTVYQQPDSEVSDGAVSTSALNAEIAAREAADSALDTRLDVLEALPPGSVGQASEAEIIAGTNVDKYVAPDLLLSAIGQSGALRTAINAAAPAAVSQASEAEIIAGTNVDKYVAPDLLVSAIGQPGALQTAISALAGGGGGAAQASQAEVEGGTNVDKYIAPDIFVSAIATQNTLTDNIAKAARIRSKRRMVFPSGDTTGATDTAAIKAARDALGSHGWVELVPAGQYYINDTILMTSATGNVSFSGGGGGAITGLNTGRLDPTQATVIYWAGANNGIMFDVQSVSGWVFEGIALATYSTAADDWTQQITGVTGIRLRNNSTMRRSTIERFVFWRLAKGIHYYDDASNGSSDHNMDPHAIHNGMVFYCTKGVVIEQTNVYDTTISEVSFYGYSGTTEAHVHVVKGHVTVGPGIYLGQVKTSGALAALYVETGWLNAIDCYSETHHAPFLRWDTASPVDTARVSITNCMGLQSLATLPNSRSVVNNAAGRIVMLGGRMTGKLYTSTANSYIDAIGVQAVYPDSTSSPDTTNIQMIGGNWVTSPSVKGIIARMRGTIIGDNPRLYWRDDASGDDVYLGLDAANDRLEIGTTVHGTLAHFPFNPRGINLNSANSLSQFASKQRGVVTLSTGSPTTSVTGLSGVPSGMYVFLSPANAAAANLMNTTKIPYASTTNGSNAFDITTADGTNATAGCNFNWWIA